MESYIKIQINFVELLKFRPHLRRIKNLIPIDQELQKLFPKSYELYSEEFSFKCYSYKEIFCEKVRAIYTRRGFSPKDFLDIFFLIENYNIEIGDLRPLIIEKIKYSMDTFKKYRHNLKRKKEIILSNRKLFNLSDIQIYLIKEIDKQRFGSYLREFHKFLSKMVNKFSIP